MTKAKISKAEKDFPTEYAQGRRARIAGVERDDAPYGDGDQLGAWNAGYDDDSDPNGEIARMEAMSAEPAKADGQLGTAGKAKKA